MQLSFGVALDHLALASLAAARPPGKPQPFSILLYHNYGLFAFQISG
jgi:hypothetical protein